MPLPTDILRNGLSTLVMCALVFGLYLLNERVSPGESQPVRQDTATPLPPPSNVKANLPEATASLPTPPKADVQADVLALQLENEDLKTQLGDVLNWILANFQGRVPLSEQALSHLNLPPMDEDFALHPDLAEFLNISTDEKFLMEDAFDFTRGNLRVLQDQNLSITSPTPAQVMMTFAEFPEQGQALREDLYAALEASLGPERLNRLLTVSDESLNSAFDYFGQASRTLMFEIILDEADNQLKVVVNDGWFNSQDPDQALYSEKESVVSSLPKQYNDFQYLLPDSFTPFMQIQ